MIIADVYALGQHSFCGLVCFRYFTLFTRSPSQWTPELGTIIMSLGFPSGSEVKASACNAGDLGSIPRLEDALEKEMATHSSLLAWRIPWVEESGGLQSMGLQRVGHD